MEISNREAAAAIWLLTIFIYALRKAEVRHATSSLLRSFLQRGIVIVLGCASLWVTLSILLLHTVGLWTADNLKTTLIWGVAFALTSLMDINRIDKESTYFKQTIKDTINVTALVTFIAEMHSYSLLVEFLIFPILAILTMMQAISNKKPEHKIVHNLCNLVLSIAGIFFVYHSIAIAADAPDKFATLSNLREFCTPITLTLAFLPFIYLFAVFISYERIFIGLNWRFDDQNLIKYAKNTAMRKFGFNLPLLRRWARDLNINRPTNTEDIDRSIRIVKARRRIEKRPPLISSHEGWSPYSAKNFLVECGIPTNDYHQSFSNDWISNSDLIEIGESHPRNNISYYTTGNIRAAKQLKIKLNINFPDERKAAEATFKYACFTLLQNAETFPEIEDLERIESLEPISVTIDGRNVFLATENYEGGIKGGYSRTFVIEHV